jgi:Glycosyl hydrolase family 115
MGSSHQEPMLRAQKEWDWHLQREHGNWNYAVHPDVLSRFWREGVRARRQFESIYTIGLRGQNDTAMIHGEAQNIALLEKIVSDQRRIIAEEVNSDVSAVPQLWCLYKEVQDYYEAGLRVPDDVTLLWAEDNWGNLRRVPSADERPRPGGAGIYYHFDYHGGPRGYQWINTNPLPKIWDQMTLAKQYGADRIWIVNVGHFKGYELPMEFFLDLAWDTERWPHDRLRDYTRLWAAREFGAGVAAETGAILDANPKFNARRKPELLAPDTFSLVQYGEADRIVAEFRDLAARADRVYQRLPAHKRDAYYQLACGSTSTGHGRLRERRQGRSP